jgi:hypothetical protein
VAAELLAFKINEELAKLKAGIVTGFGLAEAVTPLDKGVEVLTERVTLPVYPLTELSVTE